MRKTLHDPEEPFVMFRSRLVYFISQTLVEDYDEILEAAILEGLIHRGYISHIARMD